MSKKLYASLVPLLAVAALAMSATESQAAPHWYKTGTRLPETGAKTTIGGSSTLTLSYTDIGSLTCHAVVAGTVDNPAGGGAGRANITTFTTEDCESPSCPKEDLSVPTEPPFTSVLTEEAAGTIRDSVSSIKLHLVCDSVFDELFSGTLAPAIVNGSPTHAVFGAGSGELSSEIGPMTVTGEVSIMHETTTSTESVEARNP